MTERPGRWFGAIWFAFWALSSSVWCVTSAARLGATFDEPTYVAAGLDRWRDGGIGGLMRLGTMPLPVDAITLPIWIAERGRDQPFRIATDGRGRVTESADLGQVLPIARTAALVFWWILLAAAWKLGRQAGGPWGACLAVAFLAVEPTLLAHASLATTDVAVTAFLLAFAGSIGSFNERPRAWLAPGLWFGLALLSKASALVFAPLIALAGLAMHRRDQAERARRDIAKAAAVALAVTFLYCGSDWQTEDSFVAWARSLPAGPAASAMRVASARLSIFSNAGEGIVQQVKHNIRGHGTFLLGRTYARATWHYFPVVLSIKTSGAILVGLVAIALLWRRVRVNWLLAAAAVILVCSPAFRVQTGVRMVLPVLALAIVGLAGAIARGAADVRSPAGVQLIRIGVVMMIAWSSIAAFRSWPDGLRFANEAWGGPDHAYRFVSDSNYDWGQGLPELREWLLREGRESIEVWYWGTDPEIRSGPWRVFDVRAITPADEHTIARLLRGRELAVSATLLYGSVLAEGTRVGAEDRPALDTAEALRRLLRSRAWIARTGTFFIYDFTPREPSIAATPTRHTP